MVVKKRFLALFFLSLSVGVFLLVEDRFKKKENIVCLKPFDSTIYNEKTLFDLNYDSRCFVFRSGLIDLRKKLLENNCKLEVLSYKFYKKRKKFSDADALVVFDIDSDSVKYIFRRFYKNKALFLFEPIQVMEENYDLEIHKKFDKIFTWCDDLVDNDRYLKFYWPQPSLIMQESKPFFLKKLCVMICVNKFLDHQNTLSGERRDSILFFNEFAPEDFDLYGVDWEKENLRVYRQKVPLTKASDLTVGHQSKIDCLKNYRFSLCYENLKGVRGYITEKIFDCFIAGCVPIYWGAENIEEYIPSSCYIDRRKFKDNEELYAFLKAMPESNYLSYIENIRRFLASPEAQKFSKESFIATFFKAINR